MKYEIKEFVDKFIGHKSKRNIIRFILREFNCKIVRIDEIRKSVTV